MNIKKITDDYIKNITKTMGNIEYFDEREARKNFINGFNKGISIELSNIQKREMFDNFYNWLDNLSQAEYDDMSLTDKIETYFFKNNE